MTLTPAPWRPSCPGFRSLRSTIASAARPRYASVLPPPVGCETGGVGNPVVAAPMLSGSRQRHRDRPFVRLPQPCRSGLPVGPFDLGGLVVPPTHDHGQGVRVCRHEEAQAHRRREEAFLRSLALLRRLLGETARLRRLVDVVFLVGIRTQLQLRAGWNQESGQIPVRRSHPAGQPLGREGVTTPGANQIQVQSLDQALAHLDGVGQGTGSLLSRHRRNSVTARHSLRKDGAPRRARSRSNRAVSAG